jgi:spore coat protein H
MDKSQQFRRIILVISGVWVVSLWTAFSDYKTMSMLFEKKNKSEVKPNYETVFPQDKVNRIDMVIKPSDWQKITTDMEAHFGKFGSAPAGMMPPPGFPDSVRPMNGNAFPPMPPAKGQGFMPPPFRPDHPDSAHNMPFPPDGKMMPMPMKNYTGMYVPCTLYFEGKEWKCAGIRVKGNSSLLTSWSRGIKKLPFRIDFNKYKDSLPEIKGQSFFGFTKLSFSNNNNDNSFLREKITADLFREAGVKAPHTAFYRVYIDIGEGPVYFGLYTAVEVVDDTMLKDQFGDDSGNCYKPDGEGARFAAGTFETASFEKKANKKQAEWGDVQKLHDVLNSDLRKSGTKHWQTELESVFDVPAFINWLAVNTTIQNWDTYGQMAHNYYLYNNPSTNKLVWIPWDNNEALRNGGRGTMSLSMSEVTDDWPLIRYLVDVPEYSAMYKADVKTFITNVFQPGRMEQKYQYYHDLIRPYVIEEQKGYTFLTSEKDFQNALEDLKKHAKARDQEVKSFLAVK